MKDISDVVESVLRVEGVINVKPYNKLVLVKVNQIVMWDFLGRTKRIITKFGDETWFSSANNASVAFAGVNDVYKYQLKAIAVGMFTQGSAEGMDPLKCLTIRKNIGALKRLAKWLTQYNIMSFGELDSTNEFILRNIIHNMVKHFKLDHTPSFAESLQTAIYWLKIYGLVENVRFYQLMYEYLNPYVVLRNSRRNKHNVIPTRILKLVIGSCETHIEKTEKIIDKWEKAQNQINASISQKRGSKWKVANCLSKSNRKTLDKHHHLIKDLRKYVYILVLAFTGMRGNEVLALKNDAAIKKGTDFYIKTLLSKTTDNTQVLEWVCNEITFKSVKLLARVNQIYFERARLMQTYNYETLTKPKALNIEFGFLESGLFEISPYKLSFGFAKYTSKSEKGFANINRLFSIKVNAEDIKQLNKNKCNNQSVSFGNKGFKKPYQVGDYYNFTAHQFRHTFAWFVISTGLGDLDDIKYQFKHLTSAMTMVYSQSGYETMDELIGLTANISDFINSVVVEEMVVAAKESNLAGKGGDNFTRKLSEILKEDLNTGSSPHFRDIKDVIEFTAKNNENFRGLSHGYCTKGNDCKVRNAGDPSHCVNCDSYIATPRHLPHWQVIKNRCESQLEAFCKLSIESQERYKSFSRALNDNLDAANSIINQLTNNNQKGLN